MFSKILDYLSFTCKLYSLLLANIGLLMVDMPSEELLTDMFE